MKDLDFSEDSSIEHVSDLDEGRVAYIAAMSQQLSIMATKAAEAGLADLLAAAAKEAAAVVERRNLQASAATIE